MNDIHFNTVRRRTEMMH